MKKIILILTLLILSLSFCNAQFRGYGKGFGIGIDTRYNTENKSDFANLNLSFITSSFSDNVLYVPFVSFGLKENGKTVYKRQPVTNHTYLWEFGCTVLFQLNKHLHLGPRIAYMLDYNRYKSFVDNENIDGGIEIQYNFNSNYRSIANNAIYFNISRYTLGMGFRYYIF